MPLLGPKWQGGVQMVMLVAMGLMASGLIGVYSAALTAHGCGWPVLLAQLEELPVYLISGAVFVALHRSMIREPT